MPIEVPYLEQYFVLIDAKFANFFFNIALRPELVHHSSDWGIDSAWCAAAKSWDSSRPGCHLIPVIAFQDDKASCFGAVFISLFFFDLTLTSTLTLL